MSDTKTARRRVSAFSHDSADDDSQDDGSTLLLHEIPWKGRQPFLESKGYMLRPRLRPGWIPSWTTTGKDPSQCEDSHPLPLQMLLVDAVRMSDGETVAIKKIKTADQESNIALFLQSEHRHDDPRNHPIPILDVLQDPEDEGVSYMVMPFLRPMGEPPFQTVGEVVQFVDQILEGLVFMHEQGIAHRDCSPPNIMMDADAMFPRESSDLKQDNPLSNLFRSLIPTTIPRSIAGVRYYFVDFGMASHIVPGHSGQRLGAEGRDEEVPELSETTPYDPFEVDVFSVGNILRHEFHEQFSNMEFLAPLVKEMVQDDPARRPSASEALQQWCKIRRGVSVLQGLRRLQPRKDGVAIVPALALDVFHVMTLGYAAVILFLLNVLLKARILLRTRGGKGGKNT